MDRQIYLIKTLNDMTIEALCIVLNIDDLIRTFLQCIFQCLQRFLPTSSLLIDHEDLRSSDDVRKIDIFHLQLQPLDLLVHDVTLFFHG